MVPATDKVCYKDDVMHHRERPMVRDLYTGGDCFT